MEEKPSLWLPALLAFISRSTISVLQDVFKDIPASDALNRASMERLRQSSAQKINSDWHLALNIVFGFMTSAIYNQCIGYTFHYNLPPHLHLLFHQTTNTRSRSITCLFTLQYRPNVSVWIWKAVTAKRSDVLHLTVLLSHNKTLSNWPSGTVLDCVMLDCVMLNCVMLLGSRYSTFLNNVVVSCPKVKILIIYHSKEMCV
jgi:hypothetical protein